MITRLVNGFPIWALLASLLALWEPRLFTWLSGPLITLGLGVIMLGMGVTLEFADFRRVSIRRGLLVLRVGLQYTVMSLLGWGIAALFQLPTPFAVGN